MPIYLMDLVKLSDEQPERLVSLLSARHRRYVPPADRGSPGWARAAGLYYPVLKEIHEMLSQSKLRDLPGAGEVTEDVGEIMRKIAASMTPEEIAMVPVEVRLHGVPAEDILKGLAPEQLDRLRALLLAGDGGRRGNGH